nr:TOBE domain-containing protein [Xanthobacter agilis]
MRAGRLVQVGTPEEIYAAPVDRFVSEFVGEVNVIEVTRAGEGWQGVDVPGAFRAAAPHDQPQAHSAFVVIRPEYMRFLKDGEAADNMLEGVVYNEYSLGSRIQYQVRVGEKVMLVELSRANALPAAANRNVRLGWDVADAISVKA